MVWTSIRVKRMAKAKWGDKTEKGLGWYAAMRSIQMRFLRLPEAAGQARPAPRLSDAPRRQSRDQRRARPRLIWRAQSGPR